MGVVVGVSLHCWHGDTKKWRHIRSSSFQASLHTSFPPENEQREEPPYIPNKKKLHKSHFLQKLSSQKPYWDQARLSSLVNKQVGRRGAGRHGTGTGSYGADSRGASPRTNPLPQSSVFLFTINKQYPQNKLCLCRRILTAGPTCLFTRLESLAWSQQGFWQPRFAENVI